MSFQTLIAASLAVVFTVGTSPSWADATPKPIVVDADMGGGDVMALLYLLERPDANVLAIGVTGTGEAHCKAGVKNAMGVLQLVGKTGIPVACGPGKPMSGNNAFPAGIRNGADTLGGATLPANPNKPASNLVDLLKSTIGSAAAPVTVVTLGPLTDIGALLAADPAITSKIAAVYAMGGAVTVPGNLFGVPKNTTAEWNIYIDPAAAAAVFKSGIPLTLIGLDATQYVPFSKDVYNKLKAAPSSPAAKYVTELTDKQMAMMSGGGWYYWDPLAAAAALDPTLVTSATKTVTVVTAKGSELGRTKEDSASTSISVAINANADAFYTAFVNALTGQGTN